MLRLLIITGPGGDAQGWGNLEVTRTLCQALNSEGKIAEMAYVNTMGDFLKAIDTHRFDMIWSALYYITDKEDIIGHNADEDAWVADIFDQRQIPYIGPNARTMKDLINKTATHNSLRSHGISVPAHYQVDMGRELPDVQFPAFVKPGYESRSVGISDNSVVNNPVELRKQVAYVHKHFEQSALIEDYLPGEEYTVLMIGNGENQKLLPGVVTVKGGHKGQYPILRSDMRGVGITQIKIPTHSSSQAKALCRQAVDVLGCMDHVRVDMRFDAQEQLKIIEVNGIPGLKPIKSWSPQMYSLYYGDGQDPMQDYRKLVHRIVDAAFERYNLH